MNICILGLWHLGSVTAACLASLGHRVVGLDFDELRIAGLSRATAPVSEPGLEDLLRQGLASGKLRFCSTASDARAGVDVLWVAYDTPIGEDEHAQPEWVMTQVEHVLPCLSADTVVLVSSQLPVGSVRRLQQRVILNCGGQEQTLAYFAENLRLGSALNDFLHPERIVMGVASDSDCATPWPSSSASGCCANGRQSACTILW